MHQLLNQFDLRGGVTRPEFAAAWAGFCAHLIAENLAMHCGPLYERQGQSGYDTDATGTQTLMAVITFRDQAQADLAWARIQAHSEPLGQLHRRVISMVHDPVFTFWKEL